MTTPIAASLPATVRFVGPWTDDDRAQVIATLTPLIPALTAPWVLNYEHDATATTRTLAVIPQAYSATVERDGQAQPVLSRYWELPMFCRQLAAHVRAQAEGQAAPTTQPIRRSPLEVGQWLTKKKFELRYQTSCMGLSHRHCRSVVTSCPGEDNRATLAPNPTSGSEVCDGRTVDG